MNHPRSESTWFCLRLTTAFVFSICPIGATSSILISYLKGFSLSVVSTTGARVPITTFWPDTDNKSLYEFSHPGPELQGDNVNLYLADFSVWSSPKMSILGPNLGHRLNSAKIKAVILLFSVACLKALELNQLTSLH